MKSITCKICNRTFKGQITGLHLKSHNINSHQYQALYGPTRTDELILKCQIGAKLGGGFRQGHKENVIERQQKQKIEYDKNPKHCPNCGKIIEFENKNNKFCNQSCSASYHNKQRVYSDEQIQKRKERFKLVRQKQLENHYPSTNVFLNQCKICGKDFWNKRKNKTCSKFCKCELLSRNQLAREYQGYSASRQVFYKGIKLGSSFELMLARLLDKMNITWIRPAYINYITKDNKQHKIFPDFYLPDYDLYIDPKNNYLINKDQSKFFLSCSQNKIDTILLSSEHINEQMISEIINKNYINLPKNQKFLFKE